MRLKPPVSTEEALEWLTAEAKSTWGIELSPEVDEQLKPMAEAMAAVSAAAVPEEMEPLLL